MLPTPEQERAAVRALWLCLGLAIFGAVAAMIIVALALKAIADWVFA